MLKDHPKGIMIMFFTEMWERFGFYILMAVLVLYMNNEFGWDDSTKGDYYGLFLFFVYSFPLLGGYIGDKLLGQITTINIGASLMAIGYAALAISSKDFLPPFYLGLFLVALGTGIFKVNMSLMIGNLYRDKPDLRDAGFNIYYMGVNVGATIAPLAATLLFSIFGNYHASFWAASIGMLVCLFNFGLGKNNVKKADRVFSSKVSEHINNSQMSSTESRERILALGTLFIIVIFFWVAFYQNGFALTLFAERSTIKSDILRPETYQFFNPFFILVLTPLLLGYFKKLNAKGKEPSTPMKIFGGMLIMGIAMVIMIFASTMGGNEDSNMMSPAWLISTYLVVTLSEILISPMGLSYVSKVAPPKIAGLMMGGWYLATSVGSYGSGLLGKYYSDFLHHEYFLILTAILVVSAVLVILAMKKLKQFAG